MPRSRPLVLVLALSALAGLAPAGATAAPTHRHPRTGTVSLVSVATDGGQVQGRASLNGTAHVSSADGRFVAFATDSALDPRDVNDDYDVYVRDTLRRTTRLISTTPDGGPADGASYEPSLSSDGSTIAFTTTARNLTPGLGGQEQDVVVRHLRTGAYEVVSAATPRQRREGGSFFGVVSGDGRHVAFQTFSPLVAADTDENEDVYVRDLRRGQTAEVSVAPDGRQVPTPNLVGGISDHGEVVTFGDDLNVWVHDVRHSRTRLVWHEEVQDPEFPAGSVGRPAVSGNARYVAFASEAVPDLGPTAGHANVYRFDLRTGRLVRVSRGLGGAAPDGASFLPSLSSSGRYVGFGTEAGNVVRGDDEGGDSEAVVVDLKTGRTTWASPSAPSRNDESGSSDIAISADGNALVYASYDDELTPDDANGRPDVFVWRRGR